MSLRLTVPGAVAALLAGSTVLAPAAHAQTAHARSAFLDLPSVCTTTGEDTVGQQNPDDPNAVDFTGTGQLTCVNLTGALVLEGKSTFSGTIPKDQCTGVVGEGYVYRATVAWNDGTTTSGQFHNFHQTTVGGTAVVVIAGRTARTSTRFTGWTNTIVSASLGGCGTPIAEEDKVQVGSVIYTP